MSYNDKILISKRLKLITTSVIFGFAATVILLISNERAGIYAEENRQKSAILSTAALEFNHLAFDMQRIVSAFLVSPNISLIKEFNSEAAELDQLLIKLSLSVSESENTALFQKFSEEKIKVKDYLQRLEPKYLKPISIFRS